MCGITALFKFDHSRVELKEFRSMCSAIAHRGPDGAGYAFLENDSLALGSVRLSIMDLENGEQPLYNKNRSIVLVCNGEIYDYKFWRKKLENKGHIFITDSDSELIIHLYQEFGIEFISKLNGEFAFVLWDRKKKRLLVARDRAGVKPLFYYKNKNLLAIGSEVKALFSINGIPRKISEDYLSSAALGVVRNTSSVFENIKYLKPGHYFTVESNLVSDEKPYHQWDFIIDESMNFDDAVLKVRNSIENAVGRRLVSDVPINCYLSGGLDSTIITGLMARKIERFTAFHVSFPNSTYNEYEQAKTVANYYGLKLESVTCSSTNLLESLIKTVEHIEMPFPNCNSVGKFLLAKLVNSKGSKVCLTGEGADELFGGYAYFKQEVLWRQTLSGNLSKKEYKFLWGKFQEIEYKSENLNWSRRNPWQKGKSNYFYPSALHFNSINNGKIIPWLFKNIFDKNHLEKKFLEAYSNEIMREMDPFNATRFMALQVMSGAIIPFLGDRIEMANSVECRTPFLDSEVINLVKTIPPKYFIDLKTLREKHVLHQAFSHLIPEHLVKQHKHPFLAPQWKSLLDAPNGKKLIDEYLSVERIKRQGIFNVNTVWILKSIWSKGSNNCNLVKKLDPLIGLLLTTNILQDKFIENIIPVDINFQMKNRSL